MLVVGGSLVGLSAAVFLRAQGVKVTLLEPHTRSHPHPRAVGFTPRTQELFDTVGLKDALPDVPRTFRLRRATVESLAGKWREEVDWTPKRSGAVAAPAAVYSPHSGAGLAQDRLEPLLRDRARALGAELRLGSRLERFTQDEGGVTAVVRDAAGGEVELRAQYLVAADGARSGVREALGIGSKGPGTLQTVRSVLFRAPLNEYLRTGIHQFEIDQPGLRAFLTTYGDDRWVLMFLDEEIRDEGAQRAAILQAIGRSAVPVELLVTGEWELKALIADRFSEGRVFLAGDAAHTLPPTRGGYGANTGIADAHNLAWKLAAVLSGTSRPALLETYDAERRPVAWTRLEQTFARPDYAKHHAGYTDLPLLDEAAIEFGQLYRSAGILGAGPELPVAALPDVWRGQPGTRAPYVELEGSEGPPSTLAFFGHRWVLISADTRWVDAARGLPVDVRVLSAGDAMKVCPAFGIGERGASLVRPDGVVAWRTPEPPDDSSSVLGSAFSRVSFAEPPAA